jgi:hypothetical protein
MTTVRVFINARGVDVPAGSSVIEAVRLVDAAEAQAVVGGTRAISDSRGLPVPTETSVYAGAIYRVINQRARDPEAEL